MLLTAYGLADVLIDLPLGAVGSGDYAKGLTLLAADVQISKDGGSFANLATTPVENPAGTGHYTLSISAAEATCKRAKIKLESTATPVAFEPVTIHFRTYGNASAQYRIDLGMPSLDSAQWTSARAALLDYLTGPVATTAQLNNVQNNVSVRIALPATLYRPPTGSDLIKIYLSNFDNNNNQVAADSAPTVAVVNETGTSRSGQLQNPTTHVASTTMLATGVTGRYWIEYALGATDAEEILTFTFTVVNATKTKTLDQSAEVVEGLTTFGPTDRTNLSRIATDLTTARAAALDKLITLAVDGSGQVTPVGAYGKLFVKILEEINTLSSGNARFDVSTGKWLYDRVDAPGTAKLQFLPGVNPGERVVTVVP